MEFYLGIPIKEKVKIDGRSDDIETFFNIQKYFEYTSDNGHGEYYERTENAWRDNEGQKKVSSEQKEEKHKYKLSMEAHNIFIQKYALNTTMYYNYKTVYILIIQLVKNGFWSSAVEKEFNNIINSAIRNYAIDANRIKKTE